MPKINQNATEQNTQNIDAKMQEFLPNVVITTNPVVICGVNRRIGLGNYEHLDIYAGIALPISHEYLADTESLNLAIAQAAEQGFNIVSKETYDRYMLLVEAQKS